MDSGLSACGAHAHSAFRCVVCKAHSGVVHGRIQHEQRAGAWRVIPTSPCQAVHNSWLNETKGLNMSRMHRVVCIGTTCHWVSSVVCTGQGSNFQAENRGWDTVRRLLLAG